MDSNRDLNCKIHTSLLIIFAFVCNWSHAKGRNRLKQETMNNIIFVMANANLDKKKQFRRPPEELHLGEVGLWRKMALQILLKMMLML